MERGDGSEDSWDTIATYRGRYCYVERLCYCRCNKSSASSYKCIMQFASCTQVTNWNQHCQCATRSWVLSRRTWRTLTGNRLDGGPATIASCFSIRKKKSRTLRSSVHSHRGNVKPMIRCWAYFNKKISTPRHKAPFGETMHHGHLVPASVHSYCMGRTYM